MDRFIMQQGATISFTLGLHLRSLLYGLGSVHIYRRGQLIKMMLKLELIITNMKESMELKARQN
jgi:NADH:ubiquinone oxidoreductase subunit K